MPPNDQSATVTITLKDRFSAAIRAFTKGTSDVSKGLEDADRRGSSAFRSLREQAARAGRAINNIPTAIVSGFKNAFSAIFSLRNALVGLVAALGIQRILANFKSLIEQTDRLVKSSKALNIPIQQFQALAFAASQSGASIESLQQSLAIFTRVIGQFTTFGTGPGQRSLERLGIGQADLRDANGRLLSIADVFTLIVDRIGTIQNETERSTVLFDLFGRSALNLAPLIQEGGEGVRALLEEARALGGVLTPRQAQIAERVSDSYGRVAFALQGVKNLIIETFGPAAERILDSFAKKIAEVRAEILPYLSTIGLAFDKDAEGIAERTGRTVEEILQIQAKIREQFTGALSAIVNAAGQLAIGVAEVFMSTLGRGLVRLGPPVVKLFVATFGTQIGVGMIEAVGKALIDVYEYVAGLVDGDDSFLPGTAIARQFRDLATSTQEGIDELKRQVEEEDLTAFNLDTFKIRNELLAELAETGRIATSDISELAGLTARRIREAFEESVKTGRPILDVLNDANAKIDEQVPKVSKLAQVWDLFREKFGEGFRSAIASFDELSDVFAGLGTIVGNSLLQVGDAIGAVIVDGQSLKTTFVSILQSLGREVLSLVAKFLILRAVASIPGLGFLGIGSASGALGASASAVSEGFAKGGRIPGPLPRSATHDNVLARVQAGEWIVRARSASYYGNRIMAAINAGAIPREVLSRWSASRPASTGSLRFAGGGEVSGGGPGGSSPTVAVVAPTETNFDRLLRGGRNSLLAFFSEQRGAIRSALGVS